MSILTKVSNALKTAFLKNAEEINLQANVVKRRRKFTPTSLAMTFILAILKDPDASCENIAGMAVASGIEVSAQAVEQRYSPELVTFFKLLFQSMTQIAVASDKALAPILERFSEVVLIDSSTISLPDSEAENHRGCGGSHGGGKAALKLQTELDLRSGRLRCVQIESGRSPDGASDRQHVEQTPGSLRISDLGYFDISVLREIDESNAYFLTRVQHSVKIHVDGVKHDLVPWLISREEGVVDCRIELGSSERFGCRLIAFRVPEEIANRRRQKHKAHILSKTGRQPTAASLAACDWEYLVTNLDKEQLGVEEVIVLYRARWQIELLFKRWKSHGLIAQMNGRNDVVKMAKFWIRLCAVLIQHWLTISVCWSPRDFLSLDKVARLIRDFVREIATGILKTRGLISILKRFCKTAQATCKLNRRRKKPGTLSLLRNPEILDYVLT